MIPTAPRPSSPSTARLVGACLHVALSALLAACAAPRVSPEVGVDARRAVSGDPLAAGRLEERLRAFAHDSMLGRQAGSEGARKAAEYLAAEARRLGLRPAGEGGSYLQSVPLVRVGVAADSRLVIGDSTFEAFDDFVVPYLGRAARDLPGEVEAVFGGSGAELITAAQAAGKLVVLAPGPDIAGPALEGLLDDRFARAAGVAVVHAYAPQPSAAAALRRGALAPPPPAGAAPRPPLLVLGRRASAALLGGAPGAAGAPAAGRRLGTVRATVRTVVEPAPTFNVAAVLPGRDAVLRDEYVAFGAHLDHVGTTPAAADHDSLRAFNAVVRPGGLEDVAKQPSAADWPRIRVALDSLRRHGRPARADSVSNGADDDGSGSMALLGIAERLAAAPPRRSALFVWHTAEELGMVGSRWYTDHPTVPLGRVVAQLNVDMIGRGGAGDVARGGPAYVQLIGSRRLSTALGDLVERVNRERRHGFAFDYAFDANGHPAQYYCRSDHQMYARHGVPITFFTTGGHRDYHMRTDEVEYIDFGKLSRVAALVADVGLAVANAERRPAVDKPVPGPAAACVQ